MGYRIEGDGSYQHTLVYRDGKCIEYKALSFGVDAVECVACVDGVEGKVDQLLITSIYMIIGEGSFSNTKVVYMDNVLRGVQSIHGHIYKGGHPILMIETVLLPNIVEN